MSEENRVGSKIRQLREAREMTVKELAEMIEGTDMTPEASKETAVSCGYTCDLLSWVMAHGTAGTAWVTVQTHLNVIAVAVLMEFSCIILPEEIEMEVSSLRKAESEGIPVLKSNKTAYQLCADMAIAGIPASLR